MIVLTEGKDGVVLPVRAQPGARRNQVSGRRNGALKVAVSAPADQGKANRAILELLAEEMKLKKSQVELLAGPTSREKKILLRGISKQGVIQRLKEFGVEAG